MSLPNLKYIKDLSGGDEAFEQKFLTILKDEFPVERRAYETALENREQDASCAIVHKMKHKFNILGMEEAYECAVSYEKDLLEGSFDKDEEFRVHLGTVTHFLNTL